MADHWHIPTEIVPPLATADELDYLYQRLTGLPLPGIPRSQEAFESVDHSINLSDAASVQAFVEEALSRLPDVVASGFRARFAAVTGDASSIVLELHQKISPFLDDAFMVACYRRKFATGLGPIVARFARIVNDPNARTASVGTVVFVCRKCYNLIQREAFHLRQNGYRCFLLSMNPVAPELRKSFNPCFDMIYDGLSTYVALGLAIEVLKPDIFHVQCHMWEYVIGRFVIERKDTAKVVCELYDVTSVYAERDRLARAFWPGLVDLELETERFIFRNADGVITRFPSSVIEKLEKRYDAHPAVLELQLHASQEHARYSAAKTSSADGKLRLVYIGGLIPRLANVTPEMFPEYGHIEAWEALLEQGFDIDVLSSPFRHPEGPGYEPFHALVEHHEGFRLMRGVPQDQLAETICHYDFGLILAKMDRENSYCTADQFDGGVGTKLFAYLEAGLPILVNAEYTYMTRIIEENNLGISLHSDQIATAGPVIRGYDRAGVLDRIRRFNDAHAMEHEIHQVIDLYKRL